MLLCLVRLVLLALHRSKSLHSTAPIRFGYINVALGIDRQGVTMRKFARLVAWTAKTREHLTSGVIEDLDLLITSISHIHEFLLPVRRKAYPPGRAPTIRQGSSPPLDPNILLEVSHFVEHLNAVTLPVTDVHETIIANCYTMNNLHERPSHSRVGFSLRPPVAPLAQKLFRLPWSDRMRVSRRIWHF
jgi:hypothetical protein